MKKDYQRYTMADVAAASAQRRFTFGTGFTGAGGADIGLALAGGRPLFGIEMDREAARTFSRNFPDTLLHNGDFREVAASPAIIDGLLAHGGVARGELDVLHVSPPCNEFSRLGPGPQHLGTHTLLFECASMVNIAKPLVVTIENVPDLAGRHRHILQAALQQLRHDPNGRRAYFANSMVLMASHYGVPQRRRRLFVIAVRADVAEAVGIRSDSDVLRIFPAPTSTEISFAAAVADLHQNDTHFHPFRYAMMVSNFGPLARRLPHEPMRWITPMKAGLGTNRFTAKRCASGLPAPTITASGQQPDGRSGVLHPTEDRKLTIPEMMCVSSFPVDFVFTGTVGQAAERIGMSVPPLMAKAIADSVCKIVLQPYHVAIVAR